jgi:acyl-CoA thioesterase-2
VSPAASGASTLPFLAAASLTELEPRGAVRRFSATTQYVPWPKAYGGDLLVQAAAAGMRTAGDDRTLHAMHSLFVAPADIGATVEYEVTPLRDGRSYSTREVKGLQNGQVVVASLLSFHTGEESALIAPPLPSVIAPEELPTARAAIEAGPDAGLRPVPDAAAAYWSAEGVGGRSFDIRHVEGPSYAGPVDDRHDVTHLWLRASAPLTSGDPSAPDAARTDAELHRLALIYVCDYTILEPVLRSQGRAWTDPGLVTASLDHAIWLHDDARLDDWVLYTQTVESYANGRGLVRGTLHSPDGRLLATVAQQGMIRIRPDASTFPSASAPAARLDQTETS